MTTGGRNPPITDALKTIVVRSLPVKELLDQIPSGPPRIAAATWGCYLNEPFDVCVARINAAATPGLLPSEDELRDWFTRYNFQAVRDAHRAVKSGAAPV